MTGEVEDLFRVKEGEGNAVTSMFAGRSGFARSQEYR
jgi:hypothetical protein